MVETYNLLDLVDFISDLCVLLYSCEQEPLGKGIQNVLKFVALTLDYELLLNLLSEGDGNVRGDVEVDGSTDKHIRDDDLIIHRPIEVIVRALDYHEEDAAPAE